MRRVFFIALLALFAIQATSAVIDPAVAQASAQRFLQSQAASGRLMVPADIRLTHVEPGSQPSGAAVFYVFSSDRCFVIIAGDDRSREVLAYGEGDIRDMDNMPANMRFWLNLYKKQIEFLQANPDVKVETMPLQSPLRAAQSVNPLITANWSQNAPYWNECPVYGTDTCYTGCPATSLSMVFHYWRYPQQQTPTVPSYLSAQYGVVIDALPPTVFDWNNMLNDYTGGYTAEQAAAVAHLMRYIGQAEEMDYTISGSGAYGKDVLRAVKFFEYDENAQLLFKTDDLGYSNYSDAQWGAMIQAELAAARPIVYCAYDNLTGAGHAFNVDGYDATADTYHINWGWNGRGNGYFALNAFTYGDYTFGIGQQMIIGIQPPEGYQSPRLQAYPLTLDMESYINETATATISLKGTNLTDGVALTLNDPDGVFAIDATSLTREAAEAGHDITVTYSPTAVGASTATITCVTAGAEPLTITLNGNAPLEIYAPVMRPVNESRVTLTSFTADWTDATPARNVSSYTLEVQAKPAYSLIVEADFSDLPKMSPTNQASHASDYLPEGWVFNGSELNLEGGCICPRRNCTITTNALDLTGYDKVTVEVTARAYGFYGDGSELTISDSKGSVELIYMYSYTTQRVVLDCAETEQIVFKAGYYPMIQNIKIYAGDATGATTLRASEAGNANYRLVEGITGKSYTVRDLAAGGVYFYKVKALYIDNTESEWSNVMMVTLVEGGQGYELGDVNHNELVDIADVTLLISAVLTGNEDSICFTCADMDANGILDIADVTLLINRVLTGG